MIFLLDTGCRQGEAFKLQWEDVALTTRTITLQASKTKSGKERKVGITERLLRELEMLWGKSPKDPKGLVFGIRTNVRKSFAAVCKAAGVAPGLRRHDLRHYAATRLAQGGMPLSQIARVLGHASIQTTHIYVNNDDQTLDRAVAILERDSQDSHSTMKPGD